MKILMISPIHLGHGVGEEGYDMEFDEHSEQVSVKIAAEYEKIAKENQYSFLDASKYADPSVTDREHLDEIGHEKLAEAIYEKLVEIGYVDER